MTLPEYPPGLPVYRSTPTASRGSTSATSRPPNSTAVSGRSRRRPPFTGRVAGMFAEHGTVHFANVGYHGTGLT
jgi:hypothetical protein